MERTVLKYLKI